MLLREGVARLLDDASRRGNVAGGEHVAHEFERALTFYGEDYWLQVLRGPRTP